MIVIPGLKYETVESEFLFANTGTHFEAYIAKAIQELLKEQGIVVEPIVGPDIQTIIKAVKEEKLMTVNKEVKKNEKNNKTR